MRFHSYDRHCGERGEHRHHGGLRGRRGFIGRFGGFMNGPGMRAARMIASGDLQLIILALLSEKPRHGYEIIKAIEERVGGAYSPSPGVVYPTLTMLEEEGLATASSENDKKVYSVTPEGEEYLHMNKRLVEELFDRLDEAGRGFRRGRSPEIMKAFMNLRGAVGARVSRDRLTSEQIRKIADAIHTAAKAIDEL